MTHGYIPGETTGNAVVVTHVLAAVTIIVSGALQLIPQVRRDAPTFHRWNGRLFLLVASVASLAGLYMIWFRGAIGDLSEHVASSVNALLILVCAAMALRYALAREFGIHRRWALRLFLVVSGVWFFRIGLMFSLLVFQGPFGYDPATFEGPFLTFLGFGCFLIPLLVLECYLQVQARGTKTQTIAMAGALFLLTLVTAAGIVVSTMVVWLPTLRAALPGEQSIAETLSATIATRGIDEAIDQFHEFQRSNAGVQGVDEKELNALGYELLRAKEIKPAIRIFQLNAETFPDSGNVYDSLGEAYLADGDRARALTNYGESLKRDPQNANAAHVLQSLGPP
jgi:tetratricopeptide (TPR) repeat protein